MSMSDSLSTAPHGPNENTNSVAIDSDADHVEKGGRTTDVYGVNHDQLAC